MGVLDGLWHLFNFLAPAVAVGLLAASATKLLWWKLLRTVAWSHLAAWAVAGSAAALVAGLVWTGRDGKMVTYAAMVVACALSLGWAAFGRRPG